MRLERSGARGGEQAYILFVKMRRNARRRRIRWRPLWVGFLREREMVL